LINKFCNSAIYQQLKNIRVPYKTGHISQNIHKPLTKVKRQIPELASQTLMLLSRDPDAKNGPGSVFFF